MANRGVRDPFATLKVKSQQIGVDAFANGDEMCHHGYANLAPEQTHHVKKSGESQSRLRFREAAGEDGLQDDVGDKAYEGERLPDPHQQFGPIVIRCGPRASVLRVEDGSARDAQETSRHQPPRIQAP